MRGGGAVSFAPSRDPVIKPGEELAWLRQRFEACIRLIDNTPPEDSDQRTAIYLVAEVTHTILGRLWGAAWRAGK
jgi:hypothetical protein